ncbi:MULTISPECIES: hypothetical protein [unclassified Microcoleus]|uniref:hypothetical protein n=1 Tax=unclassified Microcoleus TaxID=2642155 RepID=UPI002FCF51C5
MGKSFVLPTDLIKYEVQNRLRESAKYVNMQSRWFTAIGFEIEARSRIKIHSTVRQGMNSLSHSASPLKED